MSLIENLKSYFKKIGNTKETESLATPEGVCPNCWEKQDWDGEYYKFIKGESGNPSNETYSSFVKNVARRLEKIQVNKDNYICETCKVDYQN